LFSTVYSESFGICFQQQEFFKFLVIQAVPSWQEDEGRHGKKSLSTGAADGSGIQFANE